MIDVTEDVKNAYLADSVPKILTIRFPKLGLTYENRNLVSESMEIHESILESESIEFVGCIASTFKISMYDVDKKLKGEEFEVFIRDTQTNIRINLFHGIVDYTEKSANKKITTIEGYDKLYSLANVDITEWYNNHDETTQALLLRDLLHHLGMGYNASFLINGKMKAFCGTKRKVTHLSALDLLKQLCQANGGFGKINRDGDFQVSYLGEYIVPAHFPSNALFPTSTLNPIYEAASLPYKKDVVPPSENLYPNETWFPLSDAIDEAPTFDFPYYFEVKYSDFEVLPIEKVIVRESEDAKEYSYGTGENKYIIQSNLFMYNQSDADINEMCKNIYDKVNHMPYVPFTSTNSGLPFLECGDSIVYTETLDGVSTERHFIPFSRTMKGIMRLRDSYDAEGVEYQSVFVTDLNAQLESIKSQTTTNNDRVESQIKDLNNRADDCKKECAKNLKDLEDRLNLSIKDLEDRLMVILNAHQLKLVELETRIEALEEGGGGGTSGKGFIFGTFESITKEN